MASSSSQQPELIHSLVKKLPEGSRFNVGRSFLAREAADTSTGGSDQPTSSESPPDTARTHNAWQNAAQKAIMQRQGSGGASNATPAPSNLDFTFSRRKSAGRSDASPATGWVLPMERKTSMSTSSSTSRLAPPRSAAEPTFIPTHAHAARPSTTQAPARTSTPTSTARVESVFAAAMRPQQSPPQSNPQAPTHQRTGSSGTRPQATSDARPSSTPASPPRSPANANLSRISTPLISPASSVGYDYQSHAPFTLHQASLSLRKAASNSPWLSNSPTRSPTHQRNPRDYPTTSSPHRGHGAAPAPAARSIAAENRAHANALRHSAVEARHLAGAPRGGTSVSASFHRGAMADVAMSARSAQASAPRGPPVRTISSPTARGAPATTYASSAHASTAFAAAAEAAVRQQDAIRSSWQRAGQAAATAKPPPAASSGARTSLASVTAGAMAAQQRAAAASISPSQSPSPLDRRSPSPVARSTPARSWSAARRLSSPGSPQDVPPRSPAAARHVERMSAPVSPRAWADANRPTPDGERSTPDFWPQAVDNIRASTSRPNVQAARSFAAQRRAENTTAPPSPRSAAAQRHEERISRQSMQIAHSFAAQRHTEAAGSITSPRSPAAQRHEERMSRQSLQVGPSFAARKHMEVMAASPSFRSRAAEQHELRRSQPQISITQSFAARRHTEEGALPPSPRSPAAQRHQERALQPQLSVNRSFAAQRHAEELSSPPSPHSLAAQRREERLSRPSLNVAHSLAAQRREERLSRPSLNVAHSLAAQRRAEDVAASMSGQLPPPRSAAAQRRADQLWSIAIMSAANPPRSIAAQRRQDERTASAPAPRSRAAAARQSHMLQRESNSPPTPRSHAARARNDKLAAEAAATTVARSWAARSRVNTRTSSPNAFPVSPSGRGTMHRSSTSPSAEPMDIPRTTGSPRSPVGLPRSATFQGPERTSRTRSIQNQFNSVQERSPREVVQDQSDRESALDSLDHTTRRLAIPGDSQSGNDAETISDYLASTLEKRRTDQTGATHTRSTISGAGTAPNRTDPGYKSVRVATPPTGAHSTPPSEPAASQLEGSFSSATIQQAVVQAQAAPTRPAAQVDNIRQSASPVALDSAAEAVRTSATTMRLLSRGAPGAGAGAAGTGRVQPGPPYMRHDARAPHNGGEPGAITIHFADVRSVLPTSPLRVTARDVISGVVDATMASSMHRTQSPARTIVPGGKRQVPEPFSPSTDQRTGYVIPMSTIPRMMPAGHGQHFSSLPAASGTHYQHDLSGNYIDTHTTPGMAGLASNGTPWTGNHMNLGHGSEQPHSAHSDSLQPSTANATATTERTTTGAAPSPLALVQQAAALLSMAMGATPLPGPAPGQGTAVGAASVAAGGVAGMGVALLTRMLAGDGDAGPQVGHTTLPVHAQPRVAVLRGEGGSPTAEGTGQRWMGPEGTFHSTSTGGSVHVTGMTWGERQTLKDQMQDDDSSIPSEDTSDQMSIRDANPVLAAYESRLDTAAVYLATRTQSPVRVLRIDTQTPGQQIRLLRPTQLADIQPLTPILPAQQQKQPDGPVAPTGRGTAGKENVSGAENRNPPGSDTGVAGALKKPAIRKPRAVQSTQGQVPGFGTHPDRSSSLPAERIDHVMMGSVSVGALASLPDGAVKGAAADGANLSSDDGGRRAGPARRIRGRGRGRGGKSNLGAAVGSGSIDESGVDRVLPTHPEIRPARQSEAPSASPLARQMTITSDTGGPYGSAANTQSPRTLARLIPEAQRAEAVRLLQRHAFDDTAARSLPSKSLLRVASPSKSHGGKGDSVRLIRVRHGKVVDDWDYEEQEVGMMTGTMRSGRPGSPGMPLIGVANGTSDRTQMLLESVAERTRAHGKKPFTVRPDYHAALGVVPYADEPQATRMQAPLHHLLSQDHPAAHTHVLHPAHQGAVHWHDNTIPSSIPNLPHLGGHTSSPPHASLSALSGLTALTGLQRLAALGMGMPNTFDEDDPSRWPTLAETTPANLRETGIPPPGVQGVGRSPRFTDPASYMALPGMIPKVTLDYMRDDIMDRYPAAQGTTGMGITPLPSPIVFTADQGGSWPHFLTQHATLTEPHPSHTHTHAHPPHHSQGATSARSPPGSPKYHLPATLLQPPQPPSDAPAPHQHSTTPSSEPSTLQPTSHPDPNTTPAQPPISTTDNNTEPTNQATAGPGVPITQGLSLSVRARSRTVGGAPHGLGSSQELALTFANNIRTGAAGQSLPASPRSPLGSPSALLPPPNPSLSLRAAAAAAAAVHTDEVVGIPLHTTTMPAADADSALSKDGPGKAPGVHPATDIPADSSPSSVADDAPGTGVNTGVDMPVVAFSQPATHGLEGSVVLSDPSPKIDIQQQHTDTLPSSHGEGLLAQMQSYPVQSTSASAGGTGHTSLFDTEHADTSTAVAVAVAAAPVRPSAVPLHTSPSPALAVASLLHGPLVEERAQQTLEEWRQARRQAAVLQRESRLAAATALKDSVTRATDRADMSGLSGSAGMDSGVDDGGLRGGLQDSVARLDAAGSGVAARQDVLQRDLMVALLSAMTGTGVNQGMGGVEPMHAAVSAGMAGGAAGQTGLPRAPVAQVGEGFGRAPVQIYCSNLTLNQGRGQGRAGGSGGEAVHGQLLQDGELDSERMGGEGGDGGEAGSRSERSGWREGVDDTARARGHGRGTKDGVEEMGNVQFAPVQTGSLTSAVEYRDGTLAVGPPAAPPVPVGVREDVGGGAEGVGGDQSSALAQELLQLIMTVMSDPDLDTPPTAPRPITMPAAPAPPPGPTATYGAGMWFNRDNHASPAAAAGAVGIAGESRQGSGAVGSGPGGFLLTEAFLSDSGRTGSSGQPYALDQGTNTTIMSSGTDNNNSTLTASAQAVAGGHHQYQQQYQYQQQQQYLQVAPLQAHQGPVMPSVLPNPMVPRGQGQNFLQVVDVLPVEAVPQVDRRQQRLQEVRQRMQMQLEAEVQLQQGPPSPTWAAPPTHHHHHHHPVHGPGTQSYWQAPSGVLHSQASRPWQTGQLNSPGPGLPGQMHPHPHFNLHPIVSQVIAHLPRVTPSAIAGHTANMGHHHTTHTVEPRRQWQEHNGDEAAQQLGNQQPMAASRLHPNDEMGGDDSVLTPTEMRRRAELHVWTLEVKGMSDAIARAEVAKQVALQTSRRISEARAVARYEELKGILSAMAETEKLAQEIDEETHSTRTLLEELGDAAELSAARQFNALMIEARQLTRQVDDLLALGEDDIAGAHPANTIVEEHSDQQRSYLAVDTAPVPLQHSAVGNLRSETSGRGATATELPRKDHGTEVSPVGHDASLPAPPSIQPRKSSSSIASKSSKPASSSSVSSGPSSLMEAAAAAAKSSSASSSVSRSGSGGGSGGGSEK